jgi:type VI secretion system secreted protein VgrG
MPSNTTLQVTLASPFDEDLAFGSLTMAEELSRPFELQVEAVSARPDLDPYEVLGELVTVAFELPDASSRYFNGHVTDFGLLGERSGSRSYHYRLVLRPWLWMLTRTSDCRIYQAMSIPDIVKDVFSRYPVAVVDDRLTGSYSPWEYCVQYRETDFNFVSRLLEQEGIHYFFTHDDGKHTLVLADSPSAHEAFGAFDTVVFSQSHTHQVETEVLDNWVYRRSIQPGGFALRDFNFKLPKLNLEGTVNQAAPHTAADGKYYDYPGVYDNADDGQRYSRTRLEELQAQHTHVSASGSVRTIAVGHLFKLDGHPRDDQNDADLLVLSSQLHFEAASGEAGDDGAPRLHCSLTAMPADVTFRPPRLTPKPFVQGPQTAIVVGPAGEELYTDEHGRVKVHFHWDRIGTQDENDSCWIRVSHPWAGKGWGSVSIPRIGQEVIVDFLEGDPDRPIITGRVYNGESKSAYPLPGAAVISGIKSNTHKGKGYNEMSMDDTAGKEKITIHAQYDMGTTVEHDDTQTVHNNRTITVDGTHTETITKDTKITISSGTYDHDVKANKATYHVQAALVENYDDTQKTTVKNNIDIKSTAGEILIDAANKITLHTGASKIVMEANGNITIDGVNIAITGSTHVEIKGGTVDSIADKQHQTKGQIVLSEGSATNTIKGGMVMLNP